MHSENLNLPGAAGGLAATATASGRLAGELPVLSSALRKMRAKHWQYLHRPSRASAERDCTADHHHHCR